jgi:hypothetical protein
MSIRLNLASLVSASALVVAMPLMASALTVSCVGTPGVGSIVWSATPASGIAPYTYLWGNGSTSSSQTVAAAIGTSNITIQATDASSTVATSTCSATVLAAPSIASFIATPAAITAGQSSVLSWSSSGATSLSISGLGTVTGTTATVTPAVTTTYTLTATNSGGVSTSSASVTVTPASTTPSTLAQIRALLAQIAALKAQILQLLAQQGQQGGSTGTTTPRGGCPTFTMGLGLGHLKHDGNDDGDDDHSGCGHQKEWRSASSTASSTLMHQEGKNKQKGKNAKNKSRGGRDD